MHALVIFLIGSCFKICITDHCRKQLHNITCHSNKRLLAAYAIDDTYERKTRETLAELYEKLDIKVIVM